MGISSPIAGIRHMYSLAFSLAILDFSSAKAVFTALLILVTGLLFLGIPMGVLMLLLEFRLPEGKYEASCSFMSHSYLADWGLRKCFLNIFLLQCCRRWDTGQLTDKEEKQRREKKQKETTLVVSFNEMIS